jgi:hypothetical protein
MAVEISPLVADRLPAPDWGSSGAATRYALPAADVLDVLDALDALDRAALPSAVQDALRRLAGAGEPVALILPPDRAVVQLLVDGRRIPLDGAARDALLDLAERGGAAPQPGARADPGAADGAGPGAGPGTDPSTAARVALVGAQVQVSRALGTPFAGVSGGVVPAPADPAAEAAVDTPPLALRIGTPLLAGPGATPAAELLADAVSNSGLFLESHAAQWLDGTRTLAQLLAEAAKLGAPGAAGMAAADPADPTYPTDATDAGTPRSALQLEALQRQAVCLAGAAWPGQPVRIEIESDRERHREAANEGDATGLFVATLTLHLPHLGTLQARIRVMEHTVGVHIEAPGAAALAPQLPALGAALAARGLQVAQLEAGPPAAWGS